MSAQLREKLKLIMPTMSFVTKVGSDAHLLH